MYARRNKIRAGHLCMLFPDMPEEPTTKGSRFLFGLITAVGASIRVRVVKSSWRSWKEGQTLLLPKHQVWAAESGPPEPVQLSLFI